MINTDTYEATLDGFALDIETIEDSFEKSIAKYEFPYRDGALLEDMGQKARTIRIRCYFYAAAYEKHKEFLNRLSVSGEHTGSPLQDLVHPKYGLIKGYVESVSVRHDDRLQTAEIDIAFVENLRAVTSFLMQPDVESAAEDAFAQGQQEQMDDLAADIKDALGSEAEEVLIRELDENLGILEQFTDISTAARSYVKEIDTYVRTLSATLNGISNPANSLIATIDYGVSLPGRVIGTVARTVERYAILYDSLKIAPARFLSRLKTSLANFEDSSGLFVKHTRAAGAMRCALEMGYIYNDDETRRQAVRRSEKTASFDVLGNYIKAEATEPVMSVNELEGTLASVREYLQEAVDDSRQSQSLKDMAVSLLQHVKIVKLEAEKIIQVDVDNEMPLHLICVKYGLAYNYAERIYSINNIKNPNFTRGTISIYAR